MPREPAELHDDFTVGLVVSDILNEDDFARCLADYRNHLSSRLEFLEKKLPEAVREKEHVMLAFDRVKHLIEAEIRWIDNL
jgi:hypothetical protein